MAKKDAAPKVVVERTYNVPLRREYLKAPNWKRTPKAVRAIKEFMVKHMKSDNVKLGKYLNLHMWKHGMKNPPHHVKVSVAKFEDGLVSVELADLSARDKRDIDKTDKLVKAKESADKKKAAAAAPAKDENKNAKADSEKKLETKIEAAQEKKAEAGKAVEKEEIKEAKKELPDQKPIQKENVKEAEKQPQTPKKN